VNKGDGKIRKRVLKGGVNAIKWGEKKDKCSQCED